MRFDFFTFGGNYAWEDVYNYNNWRIQHHVYKDKYRLLDSHNIRRAAGSFEFCKKSIINYIDALEIKMPYKDSIILIHDFCATSDSLKYLESYLKDLPANIISIRYPSLKKNLHSCANLLRLFLNNLEADGKLSFVTVGVGCLIVRKMLNSSNNYKDYNIQCIININPKNSGSDLAELLCQKTIFNKILGPMLKDIRTEKVQNQPKLPKDIPLGLIFAESILQEKFNKLFDRFESFPYLSPPTEQSYSKDSVIITTKSLNPLQNKLVLKNCKQYLLNGHFIETKK